MSAQYDLYENPPSKEPDGKKLFHARIVSSGIKKTRNIAEVIADKSSLTTGDVIGALTLLSSTVADYLSEGYYVELEGLGTFSLSLQCRPVEKKSEIHAQSINLKTVNFKSSALLKESVQKKLTLERSKVKHGNMLTVEQRMRALRGYFSDHRFITRSVYMSLTGCYRSKAVDDLNNYVEQGILVREGHGPHVLYFLA